VGSSPLTHFPALSVSVFDRLSQVQVTSKCTNLLTGIDGIGYTFWAVGGWLSVPSSQRGSRMDASVTRYVLTAHSPVGQPPHVDSPLNLQ
jgi:hypothetical protein